MTTSIWTMQWRSEGGGVEGMHVWWAVTTDEERDQTGMRDRDGRFRLSSGELPSSSGSAGETVVIDSIDIFLNLDAVVLCVVGDNRDQSSRLSLGEARSGFPRRAQRKVATPVYTLNDPCNPSRVECFSRSGSCCSP